MTTNRTTKTTALAALLLAGATLAAQGLPGCGGGKSSCTVGDKQSCPPDKVCEAVKAGDTVSQTRCFSPTDVHGRVSDATKGGPLGGARVVFWNASTLVGVAPATTSSSVGNYTIQTTLARLEGQVVRGVYDLRVSAPNYLDYPGGVRTSEPVVLMLASAVGEGDAHERDVSLAPLEKQVAGSITGKVSGGLPGGAVLVVAEAGGKGYSGVADATGAYVISNVPDGTYEVRGYLREWSYGPASATVVGGPASADISGEAASSSVKGKVKIAADAMFDAKTSVVVAVKSTGEFVPGVRTEVKTDSTYELKGIPAGNLVVLVSQENDNLIRDPNVAAEVAGIYYTFTGSDAFDATSHEVPLIQALQLKDPGGGFESGFGVGTLEWGPVMDAEEYVVEVVDVFGATLMGGTFTIAAKDVPMAGGTLSIDMLVKPGLHYQWRATAKKGGAVVTHTEERKGQFFRVR